MEVSWLLVVFLAANFVIVSSYDERCSETSYELVLKKNCTSSLRNIGEVLQILHRTQFAADLEHESQTGLIFGHILAGRYGEAEKAINHLIESLTLSSRSNSLSASVVLHGQTEFDSAVWTDLCEKALVQAKLAKWAVVRLQLCKWQKRKNGYNVSGLNKGSGFTYQPITGSFIDGTKCQFKPEAKGKRLPVCSIGFAKAMGGAGGSIYIVTSPYDDPINPAPGTLRFGVNSASQNKGGVWIIFKRNMAMVINLKEKLFVKSDTTIDGRGAQVSIRGAPIYLLNVQNVILHNFEIASAPQSDTVHIVGSRRIWADHLDSSDGNLGLISVIRGSTDVTISNCHLRNDNFNMLLGAADEDTQDKTLRVTVYRNWFDQSGQRMPHVRWGFAHAVNNYYKEWNYYVFGGRVRGKILSEKNVFEPGKRLEVTTWFDGFNGDRTETLVSSNDLLLKGATFHQSLEKLDYLRNYFALHNIPVVAPQSVVNLVTNCAGVLSGPKLNRCLAT